MAAVEAGVLDPGDPLERALRWLAALNGVLLLDNLAPLDRHLFRAPHLARALTADLLVGWGASRADVEVAASHVERLAALGPMAPPPGLSLQAAARLASPDDACAPRPSTPPTGPWAPRWCRSAAGTCRSATRTGRWPSTGPAATARSPSTSATWARCGSRAPGALDRLQRALTNDLGKIEPGRAQYTHLLDEADASVLDDIIVWWVGAERFDVMPNASNTDRVTGALAGGDGGLGATTSPPRGPSSPSRARRPGPGWPTVSPEAAAVGRFRVDALDVERRAR